jgi:dipeptidyl aminopeptidase/acylaminoacyl peptidase
LKGDVAAFQFAPDGVRVALLATVPEDETRKKLKEKGFKQEVFEEDARPARVWIARLFETEPGKAQALEITGSVRQVHWSPAGGHLAVAVTPTPSVDDGLMRQRILVVDAATGAVTATVDHAAKLEAMAWSPDGARLAFVGGGDLHDPSAGRLFVVPASGGKPVDVVPGFEGEVSGVEWTGTGTLVALTGQGVWTGLLGVSLGEAGSAATVKVLREASQPILTALSASGDGRTLAFVGSAPTHPGEVFTLDAGAGPEGLKRRTDSNPGLARIRWAKQEVIRHKARDGLGLEGVLVHPLETPPAGGRVPLILSVHGGPEAHISDGWLSSYSNPGQVAAARGFAVFYPNYRGSTGRGVAFSKLGQGDAAGKEFDDLVDAVDHLVGLGLVDKAKVGVTGGSYGGYATAWCTTRYSERFAAGVMFVGISDKISKVGTTDIPDEEFLVHARKRPWDDWQFLLERSPIYHAGNSRTPVLILHGADDPRVHPGQSKEFYRHLKLRSQAPVRLILYPGEGHGNRKAAAKYDYHLRMLQWFSHYLQGPGGAMPGADIDYALPAKGD